MSLQRMPMPSVMLYVADKTQQNVAGFYFPFEISEDPRINLIYTCTREGRQGFFKIGPLYLNTRSGVTSETVVVEMGCRKPLFVDGFARALEAVKSI